MSSSKRVKKSENFSVANAYFYNAVQTSWAETYQPLGARIISVYIRGFYLVNELSKGWTYTVCMSPQVQPTYQVFAFAKSPQVPQKYSQPSKLLLSSTCPIVAVNEMNQDLALKSLRSPLVCVYKAPMVEPSLPPTSKSPTMPSSPCFS